MALDDKGDGLAIGEVLKRARSRQHVDISTVEERTKIRIKYLRAMEQDEWDLLPNSAYAKGFLRTYAQLLGLDADALVDEYRRRYESGAGGEQQYPYGEPVLEGRRRLGGREPGSWPLLPVLAVVGVVIVGVLLVLGLTGGNDGGGGHHGKRAAHHAHKHAQKSKPEQPAPPPEPAKVALRLKVDSTVQVCLVGDSPQPLIDDQTLNPGAVEGTYNATRFDLRFPSGYDLGQFELFVDDKKAKLPETTGPTAFQITPPDQVKPVTFPGPDCP